MYRIELRDQSENGVEISELASKRNWKVSQQEAEWGRECLEEIGKSYKALPTSLSNEGHESVAYLSLWGSRFLSIVVKAIQEWVQVP